MRSPSSSEFDYIIIGGGTAGCVLAARLTEQPGVRVLLLEAGRDYPLTFSVPLASFRFTPPYQWRYRTTTQTGLRGRSLAFPTGKVVGGTSSINAMIYYRGPAASYDRWEQFGNTGWSYRDVLQYFRKSDEFVSRPQHIAAFSQSFVDACMETGMRRTDDFNGPQEEGVGFYAVLQRDGRRAGAATSYLDPARRRSNLQVRTSALVRKILLEGNRAAGVELLNGETAFAAGEVILSAGALHSPKTLMLSGIGPADHLKRIGIAARVDLPGVGEHLLDHLHVPVLYGSGQRSPGAHLYWPVAAIQYAIRRQGVLTSNCCESGAIVSTRPDFPMPDVQFVAHFQSPLAPNAVDLEVCLLPHSVPGTVRAVSDDPTALPEVDPKYLVDDADVACAIRGIRLAREIAQAPSLRRFPLHAEILPGKRTSSDADLAGYVRATADSGHHHAGTCKMGNDPMAVVDRFLRVHGIECLRVVDASIMPDIPGGNTCAPVLMIAEKAADLIRSGER